MKYRWILSEQAPPDFLTGPSEYPVIVAQLLYERGLSSADKIERFFNPKYESDLHDPFLLKDMALACRRIEAAVAQKEKIVIYADYDVDGVCGATILGEYFKLLSYPFEVYLPDRQNEGHGFNQQALESLVSGGAKLIVTVDCGTTNLKEIGWAKEKRVDVIVVDHHQVVSEKPPAAALINPHQEGDEYPFKGLCGTGLAFKLFLALVSLQEKGERSLAKGQEKWLLDLAALATVADMVPLLDENRALVKYGLIVLAQTKRSGLKKLLESAGVKARYDLETLSTNLDTMTLGFALGPRINAASRMSHANLAYELLNTGEPDRINELVSTLNENNRKRQQVTEKIMKELEIVVSKYDALPLFIVEGSRDWFLTLVGLAAGKASEKYHRPMLLFQKMEDGLCKGSLRGVEGFDVMAALAVVAEHLIQYGGHPAAAGCSFKAEQESLVRQGLLDYAARTLTPDMLVKKIKISAEISLAEIGWNLMDWLGKFEPFGMSNPTPRFVSRGVQVSNLIPLGQNSEHLKIIVKDANSNKSWPALLFRHNGLAEGLKIGDTLDIAYEPGVNEWNGSREIQLKLTDFNKLGGEDNF
ncbi:MAG: single-stranded-DNA-specific exonuclease RecJ [Parcubacteria group bacterium]|nr:single-stranded-DNA-specific exonuclease RecJ [Parcubacteria group bacterium]